MSHVGFTVMLIGYQLRAKIPNRVTTNQRHYMDRCRTTLIVWNFSGPVSDVKKSRYKSGDLLLAITATTTCMHRFDIILNENGARTTIPFSYQCSQYFILKNLRSINSTGIRG